MKTIEYQGKEWTLPELAAASGHKVVTLHRRICLLGWDVDRAVSTPVRQRDARCTIEYNGRSWTISELAQSQGIRRTTLYARINSLGWTVDDALNVPVRVHKVRPKRKGFWQWLRSIIGR